MNPSFLSHILSHDTLRILCFFIIGLITFLFMLRVI